MRRSHVLGADRPYVWVGLAGLALAVPLVGWLALVGTPAVDAAVDAAVRDSPAPLVAAARVFDLIGSVEMFALLVALVLVALLVQKRRTDAAAILILFAFAEALTGGLKLAFDRARPEGSLVDTVSASFPSGHAMRAALFAGLVAWLLHRRAVRASWSLVLAALALFVIAMAAARVVLHVHYLTDVLAGAGLGLGVAGLGIGLTGAWRARETPAPSANEDIGDRAVPRG
jgi:undecaprenyl-diphosphatase